MKNPQEGKTAYEKVIKEEEEMKIWKILKIEDQKVLIFTEKLNIKEEKAKPN